MPENILSNSLKALALGFIKFYRLVISPLSGPSCRFHPTCSQYALEAVETHGALKGTVLAVIRLSKCHPWHKRGFDDPVPEGFTWGHLIRYKRGTKPAPESTANK